MQIESMFFTNAAKSRNISHSFPDDLLYDLDCFDKKFCMQRPAFICLYKKILSNKEQSSCVTLVLFLTNMSSPI